MKKRLHWIVPIGLAMLVGLGLIAWQLTKPEEPTAPLPKTLTSPQIELSLVASDLLEPVAIAAVPDIQDKRLFVVERRGTIRIVNADGRVEPTPFLDIQPKINDSGGEMGLLGLAFHPSYASNKYFYVNYTDNQGDTVIARYQASGQPGSADSASEKIILSQQQPYDNHNGGDLQFGPDGFLYIALGDGGAGGDPQDRAQDKTTLLGKLLRIDVNNSDPYGIPADNPFVDEETARKEIWTYGLRNPWRFSFDKATGDVLIGDVGQNVLEEINFQAAGSQGGENYGWRCYEGSQAYNLAGCGDTGQYVMPIIEHDHNENRCSITGGYVYRGTAFPGLVGKYIYADYCNGQLFYAQAHDGNWTSVLAMDTELGISSFGQNSDGELFLADLAGGGIYQIRDRAN